MNIFTKIFTGISVLSISLFGFVNLSSNEYTELFPELSNNKNLSNHPGKDLLESKCYVCHHPSTPENIRIAPPMVAIKKHYKNENTSYEDFNKEIWSFVEKPTMEKAKLKGAVRKFGIMPFQAFNKVDIEKIADYLFYQEIESPKWFGEHTKLESSKH